MPRERLVELTAPKSHWRVLDVATGAGHTALAFAPHVAKVTATDITEEMLREARKLAASRGLTNVRTLHAKQGTFPSPTRVSISSCAALPRITSTT